MKNNNESGEFGEGIPTKSPHPATSTYLTLPKAIEFGEYDPDYLATFPEWLQLNKHAQFELINQALKNRNRQLLKQWADVNNILDFSKKPHLQIALRNIEKQLKQVEEDRERLLVEYSSI